MYPAPPLKKFAKAARVGYMHLCRFTAHIYQSSETVQPLYELSLFLRGGKLHLMAQLPYVNI